MKQLIISNVWQGPNTKKVVQQSQVKVAYDFMEAPDITMEEKLLDHFHRCVTFEIRKDGKIIQGKEKMRPDGEDKMEKRDSEEKDDIYNSHYAK